MERSAENGNHKKKHRVLKILCLLLAAVLVAAAALGAYTVPRARQLQQALTVPNCAITLRVKLSTDKLTADQQKFLSLSLIHI